MVAYVADGMLYKSAKNPKFHILSTRKSQPKVTKYHNSSISHSTAEIKAVSAWPRLSKSLSKNLTFFAFEPIFLYHHLSLVKIKYFQCILLTSWGALGVFRCTFISSDSYLFTQFKRQPKSSIPAHQINCDNEALNVLHNFDIKIGLNRAINCDSISIAHVKLRRALQHCMLQDGKYLLTWIWM